MMVRLKDIAEKSGVSLKTVSNVVNNYPHVSARMRDRVMKVVVELGYVPDESARRLAKGRDGISGAPCPPSRLRIGCLVRPGINKYDDPFHSRVLTGIEKEIRAGRNILAFSQSHTDFLDDPLAFNYLVQQGELDGLITFVWHDEVREFFSSRLPGNFPTVSVNLCPGCDSLAIDFTDAVGRMLDCLTAAGHTRIGFIGVTGQWYGSYENRYLEFRRQTAQRGLEVRPEWLPDGGDFLAADSGYHLAARLLEVPERPTAVLCATDNFAIAAMKAFHDAGLKLPQEMSVVGFDNIPLSGLVHPALTTIHIDQEEMGRRAVRLLIDRIHHPDKPVEIDHVPAELLRRESVAPAVNV